MPKYKQEVGRMFETDIKERFFANHKISKIPILFAIECFYIMEDVLKEVKEENPYATVSELLSNVSE